MIQMKTCMILLMILLLTKDSRAKTIPKGMEKTKEMTKRRQVTENPSKSSNVTSENDILSLCRQSEQRSYNRL